MSKETITDADGNVHEIPDGDMEVVVDETTVPEILFDLADMAEPCPVCGQLLLLPYVWIVFEHSIENHDFFVHPNCVSALKAGLFFLPN